MFWGARLALAHVAVCGVVGGSAWASNYYNGETGGLVESSALYERVRPGTILVVSEFHDSAIHHQNQRDILTALGERGFSVSVGFEFLNYSSQEYIDQYTSNQIDESTFLRSVKWGKDPFDFYKFQVLFPREHGGQALGLNLTRDLTSKVSRNGLDSLTEDERKLLPPNFAMGRDSYLERFREAMGGHVPDEKLMNYFTSQSLWDDTMAWKATEYMRCHEDQVLVIIVGDFHVAYQDGLVARLRARGAESIVSVSQIDTTDFTPEERAAWIQPDAKYGVRADIVFDAHETQPMN